MIGVGMKVRFVPHYDISGIESKEDNWDRAITGKVVCINWEHKHFTAEYDAGGTKQREAFKFWQIGSEVKICGR